MNLASLGKKLLPHIIIIFIFLIVSCAFFSPILSGKMLPQNDVRQFNGSFQEVKAYQDKTGLRSIWTNSMFGGMPTYQIAPYSPNAMFGTGWIFGVLVSGHSLPKPINALFLYFFSFYFLLLAFRVNPWIAMVGAFAYGFSSFNIVILDAGHMLQAYGLGLGPLVLAAAVFTVRFRKYFFGGALFALAMALMQRANHPQMLYYVMLILAIYLLSEFVYLVIIEKQFLPYFKAVFAIGVGGLVSIGTNLTFQLTTLEYSKVSTRGKTELVKKAPKDASAGLDLDYAMDFSYGQGETFSIMIPDIRGGAADAIGNKHRNVGKDIDPQLRDTVVQMDEYWGSQPFTSGPFYFGAIICFLFMLGLITLKSHNRWWILAVTIFSFFLSWGKNFPGFNDLMFYYFPMYSKFRSVDFTLVMAAMVMPVLAIIMLSKIVEGMEWDKAMRKKFLIAFGLTGGICLLFWLIPSLAGDFLKPNDLDRDAFKGSKASPQAIDAVLGGLQEARTEILKDDAIRSFFFILLGGAAIWLYNMKVEVFKGKNRKTIFIGIIAILVLIDLWSVDRRYVSDKSFTSKRAEVATEDPTDADNYILQDQDPDYRVINVAKNTFNDATTSYFHKSVGGYHGAKMKRFQEMNETHLSRVVEVIRQNAGKMPGDQLVNILQKTHKMGILDMMDCKYIIAGDEPKDVIINPYHLNHAWFVKGIKYVPDADSELGSLDGFNPADTAIIDIGSKHLDFKDYMDGFQPKWDSTATIKLDDYKPDDLTYTSKAATEQFAVFSEVYYGGGLGWDVFVDGQKQNHVRVNYLMRGMRVPAGTHKIEFKFEPQSFATGEKVSLISSLVMLAGLLGSIGWELWKSQKHVVEEEKEEEV